MSDSFTPCEIGLTQLLKRVDHAHSRYNDILVYQHRLYENISDSRLYGDTEVRRSNRAQIVDSLNRLALESVGVSFNELCQFTKIANTPNATLPSSGTIYNINIKQATGIAIGDQAQVGSIPNSSFSHVQPPHQAQTTYSVTPLGVDLPSQEPPPHLLLPLGYRYLGQFNGLTTEHLYREQDGHVALWFPALPGISPSFLIDKYAVTARQFSDCLNDLLGQHLVRVESQPRNSVQCCVDLKRRPIVFDALDRWRRGPTAHEPWLHTATPWGVTYQDGLWQPIAGSELLPVTLVTWWGARLYSLWAHNQPIEAAEDNFAYLPTIRQWQMAAWWDVATQRQRRYPWGDMWRREWVNYAGYWADRDVRESDWQPLWAKQANVYRLTRPLPVASLEEGRSSIGCVQMVGNVWEWCSDHATQEASPAKAVKGGACLSPQEHCSPNWEVAWRPEQGNEYVGFRCCFLLTT